MNEAQKIADAVLASVEGEDLLIEAMARVIVMIYYPNMSPDELVYHKDEKKVPFWSTWREEARLAVACDYVMRSPGDRAAYDRIVAQAKEREL